MVNPRDSNGPIPENARQLQDQLHKLLSKLTDTTDFIKNWPEAKGLITKIHTTISMLQKVEGSLQQDVALRETFQQCRIPLDLLDMLDSSKVNPDCFSRGLLREALGQLAGLKRRKLALALLGGAIASGRPGINALQTKAENSETEPQIKEDNEAVVVGDDDPEEARKRMKLEPVT